MAKTGGQIPYLSFIKDNATVIGGHILIYLKGIILMPLIIKTVGVTTYGAFVVLSSVLGIAFGLSSCGAGFRAKRYLPSAQRTTERRQLFYPQFCFNLLVILLLSCLFVLLETPVKTLLGADQNPFSIWIVPLYLLLYTLLSQGSDYFRYTSRVKYTMLASVCFPYLHIGLILICRHVYGRLSINVLISSMAFAALCIASPLLLMIIREIGVAPSVYKGRALVSDIRLGFPLILGFIVDFIIAGGDRYFIAFYLSVTDVGYYVPGYVLGSLIVFIPKAMGTALPQLLSKAVDDGNEAGAKTMLHYAIKLFMLLGVPFIFGCLALSRPVLALLANDDVAARGFWVAPVVAAGTLFYGLSLILSYAMFVRLKTSAMFRTNLLAAISSLVANGVFLFFFRAIIVAAIVSVLSSLLSFVYAYRIVAEDGFLRSHRAVAWKALGASVVMFGVLSLPIVAAGGARGIGAIAATSVLGLLVYAGALFAFGTFSTLELAHMRRVAAVYWGES